MSNAELSKLKSRIKDGTAATVNLSSNVVGSFNDQTDFPNKLLLGNTQVLRIHKAFANGSSANINFSKIQLSTMIKSGGVLDGIFCPFLSTKRMLNSIVKELDNTFF